MASEKHEYLEKDFEGEFAYNDTPEKVKISDIPRSVTSEARPPVKDSLCGGGGAQRFRTRRELLFYIKGVV